MKSACLVLYQFPPPDAITSWRNSACHLTVKPRPVLEVLAAICAGCAEVPRLVTLTKFQSRRISHSGAFWDIGHCVSPLAPIQGMRQTGKRVRPFCIRTR